MTTTTKPSTNPATLVHESEAAAEKARLEYEKANAAVIKAQRVAEEAQARAEQERHDRTVAYLKHLESAYPAQRDSLTTVIGTARQELEAAVAGDGDGNVFGAYLNWTRAVANLYALESELAELRSTLGRPFTWPSETRFSWQHDIGQIVDHLALTAVDDAINAARDRRSAAVHGGQS
jgi:hypothetical protein